MRVAFGIARVLLALAYPFLVWFLLRQGAVRALGLATAAFALTLIVARVGGARAEDARALVAAPVVLLLLGMASATSHDPRFVLAMPVLVNAVLFVQFASSLGAVPIVERFARMIDGELSAEQVAYCRTVTKVWAAFFVLNGGIAAALAGLGRVDAWTLHTGVLGYVGMGLLGAIEYLTRKARFRKFGDHAVDRVLRRILGEAPAARGSR